MTDLSISIQHLEQLFDSLDPSPFREKSLDTEFRQYLRDCAGEHGVNEPLSLLIHAPKALAVHAEDIESAIHAQFAFELQQNDRRARGRRRRYRGVVLVGFLVLGTSLGLRQLIEGWQVRGAEILTEGLLVLGWVALWRPIEALLFDRHEAREDRHALQRLSTIPIRWQYAD